MKILAFAEQRNGQFKKVAFEVVKAAKTIADQMNAEVVALVVGNNIASIAGQLGGYGASKVIVVEDSKLELYSTTAYSKVIAEIAATESAEVILLPASAMGKDVGPRISVKLNAGLAVDCTALNANGGTITATRPVYAGKGMVDVTIKTQTKIFSLRPNVFTAGNSSAATAAVETKKVELSDTDFSAVVKEVKQSSGKKDVAEADIIVSGGRGLKGPEHFKMIEDLAGSLNAAVGASRAVVDAGWRPHDEQVGQTGKTVSPSLYVAVAISGAVQHLAGMSSSKYIVAINKDKDAPIFTVADYGIVGDAFEVVPAVTAEIKKLLGK
ncbi:MAG: electron transfer flavoprotein subunit alpha/FixB family protein [Ignavibacteriales bacterium]|nr:electron transfer flavoprotein subunit alpha/FixB family protein [Ignavibacteriales bacterium]